MDQELEVWECSFSEDLILYHQKEIEGPEYQWIHGHLDECSICKRKYKEIKDTFSKLKQVSSPPYKDLSWKIMEKIPSSHWKQRKKVKAKLLLRVGKYVFPVALLLTTLFYFQRTNILKPQMVKKKIPIENAMTWLIKNQENDGSWNALKFGGQREHTIGLTSLALLALLQKENEKRFEKNIRSGIVYLLKHQNPNGTFGPPIKTALYNHGITTFTLLIAYKRTIYRTLLKTSLDRAVQYICRRQNTSGGWGYLASENANISISAWQIKALLLAKKLDWQYVDKHIYLERKWVKTITNRHGYVGYESSKYAPYGYETSTAIGVLSLYNTVGFSKKYGKMQKAFKKILNYRNQDPNYYKWYFLSYASSKTKQKNTIWAKHIQKIIIKRQIKEGTYNGSWTPNDYWGKEGGRIYTTAMAVLILKIL